MFRWKAIKLSRKFSGKEDFKSKLKNVLSSTNWHKTVFMSLKTCLYSAKTKINQHLKALLQIWRASGFFFQIPSVYCTINKTVCLCKLDKWTWKIYEVSLCNTSKQYHNLCCFNKNNCKCLPLNCLFCCCILCFHSRFFKQNYNIN